MANDMDKSKKISADGEAKKYFDLQMSLKGSSRFANILLIFLRILTRLLAREALQCEDEHTQVNQIHPNVTLPGSHDPAVCN